MDCPFGERIRNAEPIEGTDQPLTPIDLIHADAGIKLLRNLGEHSITLAEQKIARPLRCGDVNTDATSAHSVYHRQQIDFESIGVARAFAIEHRI